MVEKLESDLRLSTIMSKICEDEDAWKALSQFAEKVILKKEQDERDRQRKEICNLQLTIPYFFFKTTMFSLHQLIPLIILYIKVLR